MSKQLVLAEKPSVARDLANVLHANNKHKTYFEGKDYIVTWALGHLMTLKMPEDIQKDWAKWDMSTLPMIPKQIGIKPLSKVGGQLHSIKQLINRRDVSAVIIATDAGREGELVARWILEYANNKKPIKRLWISSQTQKAIQTGFKQLKNGEDFIPLYQSALARAKADWLIGLNVTRALTVKYDDNLSAGRVQTPTLALVRKQEKKIETFIPKTYYSVILVHDNLQARHAKTFDTKEKAEDFIKPLTKGIVEKIEEKQKIQKAPLPYDLTTLQQEANQRYQFSAKKTLSLVQSLYETHKIVTYPRTDSQYLTSDMKQVMKERLQAISNIYDEAKVYLKQGAIVKRLDVFQNNKVSDHHALIPTEISPNFSKLSNDEVKIYRMIAERFLGLFANNYCVSQTKATIMCGKEKFVLTYQRVIDHGWKKIMGDDESNQTANANMSLKQGQTIDMTLVIKKELTIPPSALNEGSLLGQMEKFGLGTPATRAEIIERLITLEMMERHGKQLRVTPKGRQLLQLVNPSLVSPDMTAQWEKMLEAIAHNKGSAKQFLLDIEQKTRELVSEIKQSEQTYRDFAITQKRCPECQQFLKEKQGRDGKLYVCTNSECTYKRRKDLKVSNHRCAQCHKKMVIVDGKNGAYFKCQTCLITEKIESGKSKGSKKATKHETQQLMKKINQQHVEVENSFAQAFKQLKIKD